MGDQSGSSHLKVLFDAALQDYQRQTGIALAKHPLAEQLQSCDSIESVNDVLREQTQAFSEFQEKDKILKPLKKTVSALHKLSVTANFGQDIGLNFPPVTAINTGLGILLSAVKGITDSYDSLVDLLESIESFLARLDIYTKIAPTIAMTEMIVKILVELLSTLALVTKQIKQGKSKKLAKKLFGGENEVEAVLQRLDRLTQEEARITAAQTLEVVHGLIQNMRVILDDGKASAEHVMEALEIMHQLASDQNKSKRNSLQKDIFKWLSPPDPWKNHHIACKSRHPGSAAWFIQGDAYSEWKASEAPISSLWIHGKPGAGKSVFCCTIIEDVDAMRKAGLASLAFFYCDFREEEKTGLRGLLSSLLAQLCHQSDSYCDTLSKFYSEHAEGLRRPSDDALVGCLKDLLNLPGLAPVYIIIDALDECPNTSAVTSSRDEVLSLLKLLINSQSPNLRICVTSRPEVDIKYVLDVLIPRHVSLHDEGGQKRDIDEYITSVINTHTKNRHWKVEHKQLVIDVLTKKANGMFRWVECQVVYICGCIPARIEHALAELPETLDETYKRSLRDINKADWEFAHRLFQFVAVATRPLRVEELAELLAVDIKAGQIPEFHEGWRVEDPVGAVLSRCSTLLAVVDGGSLPETADGGYPFEAADDRSISEISVDTAMGGFEVYSGISTHRFDEEFFPKGAEDGYRFGKVIQFSHYSVKEFLISARLSEETDIIPRRYHVSMTSAHTLAAQACLGILLQLDEDVFTSDDLEKWPLAQYAARHWVYHAQIEGVSRNVEEAMKEMFDPNKPHLGICLRIRNPNNSLLLRAGQAQPLLTHRRSLLHCAAFWGFDSIIEFLIIKHSQDVNSRSFGNDTAELTPLFLASIYGHVKAARILIEHGADVTARVNDFPLLDLVSNKGPVELVRMFIERGAHVSAHSEDGITALHVASFRGQVEIARELIERGAHVSAEDIVGKTPLQMASIRGHVEIARMLIEHGANVSAQDRRGCTPLHEASIWGQVETARILIEHGADLLAQTREGDGGYTPLHMASFRGQVEVARMLIERGADVSAQDKYGMTPLFRASTLGQVETSRILIEHGADLSVLIEEWTLLHLVLQEGKDEVARMLIEHGADVTAKAMGGVTPLHLASRGRKVRTGRGGLTDRSVHVSAQYKHSVAGRGQIEAVRMLIERGGNVSAKDKDGMTPLHMASSWRQVPVEVVHMLIEHGADVTAQNKHKVTSLRLALQKDHVEVARILVEHGADVTTTDEDGKTLLHMALLEEQVEVASMFIEHGADVTAQDKDRETPLHLASSRGQVEAVRMLIERGANVTAQNKGGETPLHLALNREQVEVVRMLTNFGADASTQNKRGETPLHLASSRGQVEVIRVLIERGGDVAAEDRYENTPLHRASQDAQLEVVQVLVDRGADVKARNKNGDTPLHLASEQYLTNYYQSKSRDYAGVSDFLLKHGADVNARNRIGLTPLYLASNRRSDEVKRVLLEHGANPARGESPVFWSPPVMSPARSFADLPISDSGEMPMSWSPPVTSPACSLADLPIPSHSSPTTPNGANTDLPQTPPPFSRPPSNDEPDRPQVFFTRRFLYSLGIVSIAIALPFFIRSVPLLSRKR